MTTRTTRPSLTDRYVYAATRRLGDDQRDDVALELRGDVADRVDALQSDDPTLTHEAAETRALMDLGDPDRLSAQYSGSTQHLIGPALFPTYVRVLRPVLATAVPAVAVVIAAVTTLDGGSIGSIIGQSIWTALTVALHICFWVTLSFAIAERSTDANTVTSSLGMKEWHPDQLPEPPRAPRQALGETVVNIVWLGVMGGLVVWQQFGSPLWHDGERVPVLDPALWSFWLPLVLVLLAVEALFELVKYNAGGTWTIPLAAVNTVTGALFAAPVAWLAYDKALLNPALVDLTRTAWSGFSADGTHTVILLVTLGIWLWDTIEGWRRALTA